MRRLMFSAVLVLAASASATLPAMAAPGGEYRERVVKVWSDYAPGDIRIRERTDAPARQRLAYAAPSERYEAEEAQPRRRSYDARRDHKPRYTKSRGSRKAQRHRRGRTVAKRPAASRQASLQRAERRQQRAAKAPAWTRRSVTTGPVVGSGHTGIASFYWQPQRVASGGWFNPNAMTAAHKTLPFGTRVRVTHMGNGRSVDVVINDRGPYIAGRIIDLSKAAAGVIGMTAQGIARIKMEILGR